MDYPVICKTTHRYTYNKKQKKKDLYILVLKYSEILQRYQTILIESNGKTYGRHYDRKLNITEKYSLQGTTQGNDLTGGVPPVRFSM